MSIQGEESAEETNVLFEETVAAKQERSECLRELQEELSKLQQLLKDFESSPQDIGFEYLFEQSHFCDKI